jgi:hypothetical protein
LHAGSSTTVHGLTVAFVGVTADSRCPIDAICITNGNATVVLELSEGGTRQRHDVQSETKQTVSLGDHLVKLEQLSPYPRSDRRIEPSEYVATLTISSR